METNMDMSVPFKEAMTASLLEYRSAREDVMTCISNGTAHGDVWLRKQLRLEEALDAWAQLPRKYFGTA